MRLLSRPGYIFIFVLALIARLLYLTSIPRESALESIDAQGYDVLARNLMAGHGFSLQDNPPPSTSSVQHPRVPLSRRWRAVTADVFRDEPGERTGSRYQPDGLRTPLYPLFVAATYAFAGERPPSVAAVQAILDSITALIVGAIVAALLGRRAGFAAAMLYALTPVQWRYAAMLLPEVLLAFLVSSAAWLLVRLTQSRENPGDLRIPGFSGTRWAIACGAAAGLAALTKPNLAGLALILGGAALWSLWSDLRKALIGTAAIIITAAVVVSPWVIRNWAVFERPFLSNADLGFVARVAAPATVGVVEGHQVPPWSPEWEARYHTIVTRAGARHSWSLEPDAIASPPEADQRERQIAGAAWEVVLANPWEAARAYLIGFARSWSPLEQTFWYARLSGDSWEETGVAANSFRDAAEILIAGRPAEAFKVAFVKPWGPLDPLARVLWYGWGLGRILGLTLMAIGVWHLRQRPALALVLLATIVHATLPPGPIGYVRFRVPVMPLITVLEVAGLVWLTFWFSRLLTKRTRGILGTPEHDRRMP